MAYSRMVIWEGDESRGCLRKVFLHAIKLKLNIFPLAQNILEGIICVLKNMSFTQKLWLLFFSAIALIAVSISIGYMYIITLGFPKQSSTKTNCVLTGSGECFQPESFSQTQVTQTNSTVSNSSKDIISPTSQPASINFEVTPTLIFPITTPIFPIAIQTNTPTTENLVSNSVNIILAEDWREFPIIPNLSPNAKRILTNAISNSHLDSHTFVKVGDCHMESGIFLSGYVTGSYRIPEGLENTVDWYSQSIVTDNITAVSGYGINTVLDPAYAFTKGHEQCLINETPLDCELRIRQPSIVLIAMGTNWIPNGEESFEKHLRVVVSRILEAGALPILATKTDNLEGNWKIDRAITQVAIDYDIPLVNIWRAMQDLPNKGLRSDGFHLTGDGWLRNSSTWLKTLENIYQIVSQ